MEMPDFGQWDWSVLSDPSTPLGALALAVVLFVAAWLLTRLHRRFVARVRRVMERAGHPPDETTERFASRVITVAIYLAALAVFASMVPGLRVALSTAVAGAGVTAVVIGFAAKSTLANFVAGFALAVYRPVRIGDRVMIEGEYGTVEDITLRHVIVVTWQNTRLVIPNEKLDNATLTNFTIRDRRVLCTPDFGVSYDTDIDLARRLILEEAARCPHAAADPPGATRVAVVGHADFSIKLRLYLWVESKDEDWSARWWMLEAVKKRFDAEGVEIPFPYRTVVYKKDLPPPPRENADGGGADASA